MTARQALLPPPLPKGDIEFISTLIETANERLIVPRWQNLSAEDAATAHSIDAVTIADTEAEAFLTEQLLHRFNDASIIGEEATKDGAESAIKPLTFTIDPVDGTRQFALGTKHFGTIVSLTLDGIISHAWIVCPLLNLRAYAARGQGVTLDGTPTIFKSADAAELPPLATPLAFYPKYLDRKALQQSLQNAGWRNVTAARSIAAECCLALRDDNHIHASSYYSPWDHAAPLLMFDEAGGYTWREHGDAKTLRGSGHERLVYATSNPAGTAARETFLRTTFN